MANIVDSISKLPKWAVIAIGGAVILLAGGGFYWATFGSKKQKDPGEMNVRKVLVDMPDAPEDSYSQSAMQTFHDETRSNRVADYWNSLDGERDDDEGLDLPTNGGANAAADDGALDPTVYSEQERYYITHGYKTKEQVDKEHAEREAAILAEKAREDASRNVGTAARKPLTQAQQDSIYFARLEKAYQMAAKYTAQATGTEADAAVAAAEEEPERKLDLEEDEKEAAVLPTDAFNEDGIVTSLDMPSENGLVRYDGQAVKVKPVKATFLKNETLTSGNRVIIRLMQDLVLSDGTRIPANTHITGTCSFSKRLKINITMLHYGGRMFPVDISVYDNDGTEGIYCPMASEAITKTKKAKKVVGDVVQSAGSIAGTIITGNPFVGRLATTGIQAATSSIGSDGTVTVSVSAGYEFYVFENVKEDNKG